ncbi:MULTISPECIES: type III secretion system domain-containing protein [Pandoraea]|uniref:type III secretion system domain-containing protein n=1 Tax=Pandoraea TaxID=93217 RepID=UPI0024142D9A|nr:MULTISPECIES: type III secretion system domain-containing protein [Pandoraea]
MARLVWQPGEQMDDGWWDVLGLSTWKVLYRRYPACRRQVDRLIVARRGWPVAHHAVRCVPPESDATNAMLPILRLVPNLRRVALAYGLRRLGCPDYLLLGTYRRALSPWLDAWQCDRLLLMRRDWPSSPEFSPETIATAALAVTGACLDAVSIVTMSSSDEAFTEQVTHAAYPTQTAEATQAASMMLAAGAAQTTQATQPTQPTQPTQAAQTTWVTCSVREASTASTVSTASAAHRAARILLPPPTIVSASTSEAVAVDDIWPRLAALERMLCMSSTTH